MATMGRHRSEEMIDRHAFSAQVPGVVGHRHLHGVDTCFAKPLTYLVEVGARLFHVVSPLAGRMGCHQIVRFQTNDYSHWHGCR